MDAGAKAYLDKLYDGVATMYEEGLSKLADTPDRRKMLRLVAVMKRKHHRAENFLKGLGRPLPVPFPLLKRENPSSRRLFNPFWIYSLMQPAKPNMVRGNLHR